MRRRIALLVSALALIGLLLYFASRPASMTVERASVTAVEPAAALEPAHRVPVPIEPAEVSITSAGGSKARAPQPPLSPIAAISPEERAEPVDVAAPAPPPPSDAGSRGAWSSELFTGAVYGAQAVFTGTVETRLARFDGESPALQIPTFKFVIERYLFVDDSAPGPIRTYVACGLTTSVELGPNVGSTESGKLEFVSELEHRKARPTEGGSVVLLARDFDQDELELPSTRWNLGLAPFLPPAAGRVGAPWQIPDTALADLLLAGGDLRLRASDSNGEPDLLAPEVKWPTAKEILGACSGAITSMDRMPRAGDAFGLCVARIELDLHGKSDGAAWARLIKAAISQDLVECVVDARYTMTGAGLSIRNEVDARAPQLELHAEWTADLSVQVNVQTDKARRGEIELHAEGQFAFLGGQPERKPELLDIAAKPRDQFLANDSFLLKP